MTYQEKLERLAQRISEQTLARLNHEYESPHNEAWIASDAKVHIRPGKKYVKVDVGTSGKYMVDANGNIYGIKAYGVIHRGYRYGTLDTIDDYYWGGYAASRKPQHAVA